MAHFPRWQPRWPRKWYLANLKSTIHHRCTIFDSLPMPELCTIDRLNNYLSPSLTNWFLPMKNDATHQTILNYVNFFIFVILSSESNALEKSMTRQRTDLLVANELRLCITEHRTRQFCCTVLWDVVLNVENLYIFDGVHDSELLCNAALTYSLRYILTDVHHTNGLDSLQRISPLNLWQELNHWTDIIVI